MIKVEYFFAKKEDIKIAYAFGSKWVEELGDKSLHSSSNALLYLSNVSSHAKRFSATFFITSGSFQGPGQSLQKNLIFHA